MYFNYIFARTEIHWGRYFSFCLVNPDNTSAYKDVWNTVVVINTCFQMNECINNCKHLCLKSIPFKL